MRTIRSNRWRKNWARCARLALVVSLWLVSASRSYGADIVFVRLAGGSVPEQKALEVAGKFYGVDVKVIEFASPGDNVALGRAVRGPDTVGVVIAAAALDLVDEKALGSALKGRQGSHAPVFLMGITPVLGSRDLPAWANGALSGCAPSGTSPADPKYFFHRVDGVTNEMSDLEVPISFENPYGLVLGDRSRVQTIVSAGSDRGAAPIFVETNSRQLKLFVACASPSGESDRTDLVDAFLRVAPALMFVRYCAGDRGWHAPHHYANFTVDDPWLRPSYGNLNYAGLFEEMEKHNFHTTIAFIPWNYDRSDPRVVSLVRSHPERFSIAIHGDNHDHKEFTDYRSKPLSVQVADLKQSLARMDAFERLTGIPYDKVMIFPHSIAPEETLEALKTYNYLATVNSTNVPMDVSPATGVSSDFRPVTAVFAGFPSIVRYSVEAPLPKSFLAVNEFLGNPVLLYGHSDFFAAGIGAFDPIADRINTLEPDTEWRSLGTIVNHLYLERLRDDSNYDVLAFASHVCVNNSSGRDAVFYVQKQEMGTQVVESVSVDRARYPYQLRQGLLTIRMPISRGGARCLGIRYANDLELASIPVKDRSLVVYSLRMASDFRDLYLSKSALGSALIRLYYRSKRQFVLLVAGVLLLLLATIYTVRFWMSKRKAPQTADGSHREATLRLASGTGIAPATNFRSKQR